MKVNTFLTEYLMHSIKSNSDVKKEDFFRIVKGQAKKVHSPATHREVF